MEALDGDVVAVLERAPGADGMGRKLSQLLLGFLATEVAPMAERLAGSASTHPAVRHRQRHSRLYADTLERPDHQ